jgi:hypothetical protein
MVSDWEYGRFQPKLDVVSRWIEALETELTVNVKDGNINYKIHHRRDGAVWE